MMNFYKVVFRSLIMQHVILQITLQFSFNTKNFKVERAASCPLVPIYAGKFEKVELTQPNKFGLKIDADIIFIKNISDPIQFHLKFAKCNLDSFGTTCDSHDTVKIDNVCDRLAEKNALWTPLMNIIQPRLMCPIKMGTYKIRNGTLDLSWVSRLPIDGFRYQTTLSFYELVKDAKPLQLMCFDSEVTITVATSARPRYKTRLYCDDPTFPAGESKNYKFPESVN